MRDPDKLYLSSPNVRNRDHIKDRLADLQKENKSAQQQNSG